MDYLENGPNLEFQPPDFQEDLDSTVLVLVFLKTNSSLKNITAVVSW